MEFIKWANPSGDYYSKMYDLLINNPDQVLSGGLDYLREEMSFKDRNDFRVETVLSMFDRYGVTEGSLETGDLRLVNEIPLQLEDDEILKDKLKGAI